MRSGTLIAGRYRLDEPIGAGGMGMVWRATDEQEGREVALKQATTEDRTRRLLRREAAIAAQLDHPSIVTFLGEVQDGDEWWLVMEYVPSSSLGTLVHAEGAMPPARVARLGVQIADALAAVHAKGVVHRDVKPSNVLVAADDVAKLTDFGISRALGTETTWTHTGLVGGTPAFLAPEVANGEEPTAASDVFSLGATLFTAVEGRPPFGDAENPLALLRRVATAPIPLADNAGPLSPVLVELMRRDPAARPDARTARRLLQDVVDERRTGPAAWKRWALIAIVVLAAAVTVPVLWSKAPALGAGDQTTADPCALFDLDAIRRFGTADLDVAYSGFPRCDVLVRGEGNSYVDLSVELKPLLGAPPGPAEQIGPITVVQGRNESKVCDRTVVLPDNVGVVVEADHDGDGRVPPDLCVMADEAARHVATLAGQAPLPRRNAPFPARSLARLDACLLLPGDALARVPGVDPAVRKAGFGNWDCTWRSRTRNMGVELYFDRGNNSFNEQRDGRFALVGGFATYTEPGGTGDDAGCDVRVVDHTYSLPTGKTKAETVVIAVGGGGETAERHCGVAADLAKALVPVLAARR
ncbi:protein kinase [Allokutzneria sp. A3M-2-11 16]|uniref:serine/threonine-protein kinase n=1 Tax=Allokutzneria sp. A3M-2-11 16 TaxID=2962043 RepID=UPI0020B7A038|nr:serine/threonine-protein kinase [Allokutzneria sp. A3M-2-11 16]MCP3803790.1 protein kinase [Allokutzneria sp. A3M-2-11 16]